MITIVYRELSSLVSDLDFSAKTLYSVSNRISYHYRTVLLPKGGGEFRRLSVPDPLLKAIQRKILAVLLPLEPISVYAAAYRPAGSTRINAAPHVGKPVILELDIKRFFDSIIYSLVKEKAFPSQRYSERNRILLAILCTLDDALPQGAPTSPAISNIIMREFDNTIGHWCADRKIAYTRYCDDMTFSGDFDTAPVVAFVRSELGKLGLFLNERKTAVIHSGQRQCVTGIVVNEKVSGPKEYKRKIRQEMHYCLKYGVDSHLEKMDRSCERDIYVSSLLGRISYVLSVEPDNPEMKRYRQMLKSI